MTYCGECGERLAPNDRFCGTCGELTDYANATDPTPLVMPRPDPERGAGGSTPTVLTPLSVFGIEPTVSDPSTDPTVPTPRLAPFTPASSAATPATAAQTAAMQATSPAPTIVQAATGVPDAGSLFDPAPAPAGPPTAALPPEHLTSQATGGDASGQWLKPARRSWSPALLVGFIALVLLAAGATVLLLDNDDAPRGSSVATTTVAATTPATSGAADTTPSSSTASSTTAVTTTTIALTPEQQLTALQNTDRETVEALVGRWVPQLSAKKVGTVDDGITYDNASVLEFHAGLRAQYGALLLYSGDYTYQTTDLWVSVAPESFATANGALQWCVDEGIGRDDCFAKLITHDPTITDTVQMQP